MKGIQSYTHAEREQIIEEMVPLIQRKFGDNLLALASSASYARGEDSDYSDLELIAFVGAMPEGESWNGMGRIRDGLLVELVWMTAETYLQRTKEVTKDWYMAGSDVLIPLINKPFIEELTRYQVENLREKCLAQAVRRWHEVQEATSKVLNAILAQNRDGIPLLTADMVHQMLIVLSFLNQTPYVTFARFIAQARTFAVKPAGFEALLDTLVEGRYQEWERLQTQVVTVFTQFEMIFAELGIELYDDNVDPN